MPLEARKYLYDIQQAIDLIDGFCAGKSFADYQQDPMLRSAVERQFEIVVLTHAYATIDDRIVWGVVEGKLPRLRDEVKDLLTADAD